MHMVAVSCFTYESHSKIADLFAKANWHAHAWVASMVFVLISETCQNEQYENYYIHVVNLVEPAHVLQFLVSCSLTHTTVMLYL